jgi:fumarate hydratase class II
MIGIQVIGDDTAVAFAGSQGNFELNAMRPVIINDVLRSIGNLSDGVRNFRRFSVEGTTLDRKRIAQHVENSVMLVTALSPVIGYDASARIAHEAMEHGLTLKEATLRSGALSEEEFDRAVVPAAMVGKGLAGA